MRLLTKWQATTLNPKQSTKRGKNWENGCQLPSLATMITMKKTNNKT
jgi:hypothetical protein